MSREVAGKINCSCDSQNTTGATATKSRDFTFYRYVGEKHNLPASLLINVFFWRNEAKLFPHRNTCCGKRLPQIFCEMWQKNNFQFLLHHTAATFLTAFLLFFPADTEYTLTTSSFKKAKQIKTRPSKLCET